MATTARFPGGSAQRGLASCQRAAVARVERAIRAAVRPARSRYLQEFAEAFPSFERRLCQTELVGRAAQTDVVLISDYHSLAACQAFVASFLRQLAVYDGRPNVLGLEAVYSASQPVLEEWWRGGVAADSLRSRLHFGRDWGYDWEPYARLFEAAKRDCEAVWGLDSEPRFDLRRVRVRDRHMAARILEMRRTHPEARALAFVGESHCAPGHLPHLLREAGARVFTILQNVDALFWQLSHGEVAYPSPVSVTEDVACVFNASPLEKYESYREYLEHWQG